MAISKRRVVLCAVGASSLAVTAVTLGSGLTAVSADAVDPSRCGSALSSADRRCPSPSTSPSSPVGTEIGCRNLIAGAGRLKGVDAAPTAGAVLEFLTTYESATCAEVTYTVIVRDMETFAELGRHVQQGNDVTETLASGIALPGYAKECVAIDVIVSEGAVVHDMAPNSRDLTQAPFADLCRQGVSEMVWN